jgi:hypothetical protein
MRKTWSPSARESLKYVVTIGFIFVVAVAAAWIYDQTPWGREADATYEEKISALLEDGEHYVITSIYSMNAEETEASFMCVDGEVLSVKVPEKLRQEMFGASKSNISRILLRKHGFMTDYYEVSVDTGRITVTDLRGVEENPSTTFSPEESAEYLAVEGEIIAVKDGVIDHIHRQDSDPRAFAAMVEQLNN